MTTYNHINGSGKLIGTSGADYIIGSDIYSDSLYGGKGDDILSAGSGNDLLHGDGDNDQLWGGNGDDALYGDSGNDALWGGKGADFMMGGTGADDFIIRSRDADVGVNVSRWGLTGESVKLLDDLTFADGDRVYLEGFSNALTAAGIKDNSIDSVSDLQSLVSSLDPSHVSKNVQQDWLVLELTDDKGAEHTLAIDHFAYLV